MYNPHKLPVSHYPRLALVLLTGVALVLSACATGPDLDLTIHESERGGVYGERISDRSFQAAHPIALSADTMAWVFSGEVVKVNRGLLENLVAGKPEAVRAFRDEDVEYLAPLLVEGLTRTASDQRLGFVSVKRGARGIDEGFAQRLRTVTAEPIPAVSQPVGRVLQLRARPRLSRASTSGNPYFAAE